MSEPVFVERGVAVHHGTALDELRAMDDASIDAVITDPPYGLGDHRPDQIITAITAWANGDRERVPDGRGFMGRRWDAFVPPPAVWDECLRVLKPGGHLACFAGSRTLDLMTLSVRMAGFEIRDTIAAWLYSSGFAKSLDVGKAIDKARDDNADRRRVGAWLREQRESAGLTARSVANHWPSATGGLTGCVANWELGLGLPTPEQWEKLRELIGFGADMDEEFARLTSRKGMPGEAWDSREVVGEHKRTGKAAGILGAFVGDSLITTAGQDESRRWEGWGTALAPAFEPIILARKPLGGTREVVLTPEVLDEWADRRCDRG